MLLKQQYNMLCIDTPNILFRADGISGTAKKSLEKLLDEHPGYDIVLLVTVKMYCAAKDWVNDIKRKYRTDPFVTFLHVPDGEDPDEVLLMHAKENEGYVVSNDLFRQPEYRNYSDVNRISKYEVFKL